MMKLFLILLQLFTTSILLGTAPDDFFKNYPNKYFVETGTGGGKGCLSAISAGFEQIYSIEINPKSFRLGKRRLRKYNQVQLYLGNSLNHLPKILEKLNSPATFWLDSHVNGGGSKKTKNSPILEELKIIKSHHIKNHIVLIDDVRLFGTSLFNHISLEELIAEILEINPDYKITFADGAFPNDILVAKI